jgi:hypothetical protein
MREGMYSATILDLGTRWRRVVSFTVRPLYPHGTSHGYPLDRRLGELQSRSGPYEEEKNFVRTGNRTPTVNPVARRYTD